MFFAYYTYVGIAHSGLMLLLVTLYGTPESKKAIREMPAIYFVINVVLEIFLFPLSFFNKIVRK